MASNDIKIQLTDAHIRGLITAAALREHDVATTVSVASHTEIYRNVTPSDTGRKVHMN